jgi:hypothetical protein
MGETESHEIEQLIDNLKSNLFFHGHPISRDEAKNDLKLKVEEPTPEVESLIWDLYREYEGDLKLKEPLNLVRELELKMGAPSNPAPLTTAQLVQQMQQLQAAGIGLGMVPPDLLVNLAAAMLPFVSSSVGVQGKVKLDPILGAYVESAARADVFKTDLRLERIMANLPGGPQEAIRQEVLWQGWQEEK